MFHWGEGKQIKSWDCDHADKMDLSDVFKHGISRHKGSRTAALEFASADRTRSDKHFRFHTIVRVLEVSAQVLQRHGGLIYSRER